MYTKVKEKMNLLYLSHLCIIVFKLQSCVQLWHSLSLLKLMSPELVIPPNHLILCRPLLLPSIFPSIWVFSVSWLFTSGGQIIGALASASILPMNILGLFPLELISLISFGSKGLSRVFSSTTGRKKMKVKVRSQSCATLCNPMDCRLLLGSSVCSMSLSLNFFMKKKSPN